MLVGDKIKKIRDLRGLKQEEVAEKLNITPQAYGKIERNETRLDAERLHQIAEIFGITVEDIQNFDDKNMFVNNLKECENSQGTYFIMNNFSDSDKLYPLLEKVITQQQEEIRFLREQLAKALENKH